MTPAEKQRGYRARLRDGVIVAPVPAARDVVAELLDRGWLAEDESEDRIRVGAAIADAFRDFLGLPVENSVTRHASRPAGRGSIDLDKP